MASQQTIFFQDTKVFFFYHTTWKKIQPQIRRVETPGLLKHCKQAEFRHEVTPLTSEAI